MALRHLIKAAKVTKRKLIWWRWKAFVFKYVSLQTTNIWQGFEDTELCKYDVFDIYTHNDSLNRMSSNSNIILWYQANSIDNV